MTNEELDSMKRLHDELQREGCVLWERIQELADRVTDLRKQIKAADPEDYDEIALLFGGTFDVEGIGDGETGVRHYRDDRWTSVHDRMPDPEEQPRVLIYTEGQDFAGKQFFDVTTDALNENYYEDPADQPEVCAAATHWMPLPVPNHF